MRPDSEIHSTFSLLSTNFGISLPLYPLYWKWSTFFQVQWCGPLYASTWPFVCYSSSWKQSLLVGIARDPVNKDFQTSHVVMTATTQTLMIVWNSTGVPVEWNTPSTVLQVVPFFFSNLDNFLGTSWHADRGLCDYTDLSKCGGGGSSSDGNETDSSSDNSTDTGCSGSSGKSTKGYSQPHFRFLMQRWQSWWLLSQSRWLPQVHPLCQWSSLRLRLSPR